MLSHQHGDASMNNRELYRDPVNGKISGVCAGIANYFGAEVWLIRIVVISAALLGWYVFGIVSVRRDGVYVRKATSNVF